MVLLSAVQDDEREGRGASYLASSEAACWAGLSECRVKLALWNEPAVCLRHTRLTCLLLKSPRTEPNSGIFMCNVFIRSRSDKLTFMVLLVMPGSMIEISSEIGVHSSVY